MLPTYRMRTIGPLMVGFAIGSLLSFFVFPRLQSIDCPLSTSTNNMYQLPLQQNFSADEETADKWQIVVHHPLSTTELDARSKHSPQLMRSRFVAKELGIRGKLFMCVLGAGPLALAINATAAHHVTRLQMFTDSDVLSDSSSVFVYEAADRRGAHVSILDAIVNQKYDSKYDWFFLIEQTTYVNPMKLMQLVSHLSISSTAVVGRPKADGLCDFTAGILLSHKAMQALIQNRSLCSSIDADSDALAFELCIQLATNLTCSQQIEGKRFTSWQTDGSVMHDQLLQLSHLTAFNNSLTVAPLASKADIYTLHRYFVLAEIDNMDRLALTLGETLYNISIDTPDGPSWPHGVPPFSRPQNFYEVPKWVFYTDSDIFKNEPNQNVRKLDGVDRTDVTEVVEAGRALIEKREPQLQFDGLRGGYRLFDPIRGMNYILDLVYTTPDGAGSTSRRVHLIRPIVATEIVNQVPYVKEEEVDLTVVVPVDGIDATMATRRFMERYVHDCMSTVEEKRRTRVVIAVPMETIEADAIEQLSRDLAKLRKRCESTNSQFDLITLAPFDSRLPVAAAALDEAIVQYGEQVMFLVLPPYADVQRELMDRVRINTIRNYQVFFPIPFVQYHPNIVVGGDGNKDNKVVDAPTTPAHAPNGDGGVRVERAAAVPPPPPPPASADNIADKLRLSNSNMWPTQIKVHKDAGHFDANDFQVASFYGSDYARLRAKLNVDDGAQADLVRLFLGVADLHIMRTTEPALRLRYHERVCDEALVTDDYERCIVSRREGFASKAQLARLLYPQQLKQQQHHHHHRHHHRRQ